MVLSIIAAPITMLGIVVPNSLGLSKAVEVRHQSWEPHGWYNDWGTTPIPPTQPPVDPAKVRLSTSVLALNNRFNFNKYIMWFLIVVLNKETKELYR